MFKYREYLFTIKLLIRMQTYYNKTLAGRIEAAPVAQIKSKNVLTACSVWFRVSMNVSVPCGSLDRC